MTFEAKTDGQTYSIIMRQNGRIQVITVGLRKHQAREVVQALERAYKQGREHTCT